MLSGMSVVFASAFGQQLRENYITWPSSSQLPTYVNDWVPGQALFEDENFFISRVKPRERFRNIATQVDQTLTDDTDKKVIYWVPIGYDKWDGVHTNAMPNGMFDSEVFSTWSYLTVYGDWISPHGWVPGGFADVAHKNGVSVSGVASIPFGSISSEWSTSLTAQSRLDNEKFAKFLYYHGVDGLGYNSEFSGISGVLAKIREQHAYLNSWMSQPEHYNPVFENIWYDGTNDNGSISFDRGLGSHNQATFGDAEHKATSLFLNYNWNNSSTISSSTQKAAEMGRDVRDLYAGLNMQGGEPGGGNHWSLLKTSGYSVGMWGAHSSNQIWQTRNSNGSAPTAMQNTYQNNIERWFTNGKRNPIAMVDFYTEPSFAPSDEWFGISRYISAQSSLAWNLGDEPFYSYFNLGNGQFFNWMGERQNDNEWYNISLQDYMPTWRFWFATEFLGNTPDKIAANGLNAAFKWDEAWMGGSSLAITGTSAEEYLHLFKTSFQLKTNDVITVRYKLLGGKANINLALSVEGKEAEILREKNFVVMDDTQDADEGVWVEKTFVLKGQTATFNNRTLAMIALHITDAERLDLRLGEISIVRGTAATPESPVIDKVVNLAYNYRGADAKVIFHMPNGKLPGEPVYNIDVNTSMFKIYAQQEGGEPTLMTATTSWAGFAFAAPVNNEGSKKLRVGVSAMSLDLKNESEIAWSDYQELPEYALSEDIVCNKSSIKPSESFVVSFVDDTHPAVDWAIYDQEGNKRFELNGATEMNVEQGLADLGGYDVVINEGKADERRLNYFIQVTAWERGALPEIQSVAVNTPSGNDVEEVKINKLDEIELAYTGRAADGESSRGVKLNEKLFGVNVGDLGIQAYQSFSVGAWIKFDQNSTGTYSFLRIENRGGNWPKNNWGFFWSDINQDGYFLNALHDSDYGGSLDSNSEGNRLYVDFRDTRIVPNGWTHVMFVFDYNESNQISYEFYVNGKRQTSRRWMIINKGTREGAISAAQTDWNDFDAGLSSAIAYGDNEEKTGYASTSFPVTALDWISFGGTTQNIGAMKASIDDFQVWDKVVTPEEVAMSMNGLDADNLPEGVLAYWDLESPDDFDTYTNTFLAKGKAAGTPAGWYEHASGDAEGQATCKMSVPEFTSGCPFIEGTGYQVTTLPTWSGRRLVVDEAAGNDTEGAAKAHYTIDGDFNVTLTLENSLGSHSVAYPTIQVGGSAINGVEADASEIYALGKTVFARFAEAGTYTVQVYNVAGELIAARTIDAAAGEAVSVTLENPAVYIVNVESNGAKVAASKVIVR